MQNKETMSRATGLLEEPMETKRSALDPHELRDLGARIDHYESTVPIWVSENFIFDQTADVGTESAVATAEAGAAGATTVKQIKMEEKDAAGQVEKVPIEGVKGAFLLKNLLSEKECKELVVQAEKMGLVKARITTYDGKMVEDSEYRSGGRLIWHLKPKHLAKLWDRMKAHFPLPGTEGSPSNLKPYGLNERLRFLRYSTGQKFEMHYDGGFRRRRGDESYMTFIVYLQAPKEGGHTQFFDGIAANVVASIAPTPGTALLFFHKQHPWSPLHSGQRVGSGVKWAIRSDVMYRLTPELSSEAKRRSQKFSLSPHKTKTFFRAADAPPKLKTKWMKKKESGVREALS